MKSRIGLHSKSNKGYALKLLTPETIKLLGSTENKTVKNKNSKNVPLLEITEVVLANFTRYI